MESMNGVNLGVKMNSIKLWINNVEVEAEPDLSVMEAADLAGMHIPRLCYHPSLKPSGACRVCAIEVDGYRGLPAACSTPVEQGMRVRTQTEKIMDFRREMLRLILEEHPRECLACSRNGSCELQQLVETVGIDFPYPPPTGERVPVQPAGGYFERDMSLCVRCGRCVRICHEVRGSKTIVFREVEGRQEVGTAFGRSLEEAGCQFCGACVDVCPVGALRESAGNIPGEARRQMLDECEALAPLVMSLYRKERPSRWKSSICPICSAGCRMSFELSESNEIIQVRPRANSMGSYGQACVQGRFLLKDYLQSPDRLLKPLVLENGGYREAEWESVLDDLARRFQGYGAWETAVLTDAGLATEELFLLQKFARTVLKTNLIGCITPKGLAEAEEALNKHADPAALRGNLAELSKAGVVLAMGVNPPAGHPIAGTALRKATLDGTKLIVANPLSIGLTRYADVNLHYNPGTEAVLIGGLLRLLLDEGLEDTTVVAGNPLTVSTIKKRLAGYEPKAVAAITGVDPESLIKAASLIGKEKPLTILYGLGLVQSANVRESIDAMVALLHLTGSVSKAGGGMISLCGGGNIQAASDIGMVSRLFGAPVNGSGCCDAASGDIYQMLASSQVKALYLASGTFGNDLFDSLGPYLDNLELIVLHDTALPASATVEKRPRAHVVLPMASVLERGGTFTSPERKRNRIAPVISPPGESRSVIRVLGELAQRMKISGFGGGNEETMRSDVWKEIAASTTLVRKSSKQSAGCCCCGTRAKGKVSSDSDCRNDMPEWNPLPLEASDLSENKEFPFTWVAKEDLAPYFLGPLLAREAKEVFYPDCEVEMNPSDLFGMGLIPGDTVCVVTSEGLEQTGRVGLNPLLPPKIVTAPMALPALPAKNRRVVARIVPAEVK
jgi:predicted molibdopterin-dependent oxidoreductase YjgC